MQESFTPRRAISVDEETWTAYGDVVGDRNRSADLRDDIDWRIDNPDTPLPGRRRVKFRARPGEGSDAD